MKTILAALVVLITCSSGICEMRDMRTLDIGYLTPYSHDVDYQRLAVKLNLCCAIREKKVLQTILRQDEEYAKRYGNSPERERKLEQIKFDDWLVSSSTPDYKALTGKRFEKSHCNDIVCDNPKRMLKDFANKLYEEDRRGGRLE